MTKSSTDIPTALLARLGAISDPARLRLLHLLEKEELAVSEISDVLQLPQSTVSRHLKLLVDEGWVEGRAERTTNFYRMANGGLPAPARKLWELAADETRSWSALKHDQLRLTRRLRERKGDSRAFYAGVAGEWDRLRAELYGAQFTDLALRALLPRDWIVADLACGSGAVALSLAPWVRRVLAVDHSQEMLAAARKRGKGVANIEWRQGELEALPIEENACDAAVMLLALSHVSEPAIAVREMARALRPGGRAVIVDLLQHDREEFRRRMGQERSGFEIGELADLLVGAGFADARCETLPTEPDAKGPALLLASGSRMINKSVADS